MSFENETFRKAARDAGISGKDRNGNQAIDDFSRYFHEHYEKYERESMGYHGIYEVAQSWWSNNRHKYS